LTDEKKAAARYDGGLDLAAGDARAGEQQARARRRAAAHADHEHVARLRPHEAREVGDGELVGHVDRRGGVRPCR
jgi:hypothetical protein